MTARSVMQVFNNYQKARITFVQSVADLAVRSDAIPCLEDACALNLLRPLLTDACPSIQQCAAIAIGRMANHDPKMANHIIRGDTLSVLLRNIDKQTKYYKKAALFVLRTIAKHNAELALAVVNAGGLETMLASMEDFDSGVKLAAVWALGYIASHNKQLAQSVIDAGSLPLVILCLQEPEICLKQTATNALADIAKHSQEQAHCVAESLNAIQSLVRAMNNSDPKLKRQALTALSAIATHTSELAEFCVEAEIFPNVLLNIHHSCPAVCKAACVLVRDIVKHTVDLAQLVVNQGGIGALLEATNEARLPALAALGYIAGQSDQLALAIAGSGAVTSLAYDLDDPNEYIQATATWTLGQIGKHTAEHSKRLAEANVFSKLLQLHNKPGVSEDLKSKSKTAMKLTLQKCMVVSALEPLLYDAPPEILKYVLGQFSKVLPNDPRARRMFVTTGGLRKIQELNVEPGSTTMEYIHVINACFPDEIVMFYSPGYSEILLDKVEHYTPQVMINEMERAPEDGTEPLLYPVLEKTASHTISEDLANH